MGIFGSTIKDKKDAFLIILCAHSTEKELKDLRRYIEKKQKSKINYVDRCDYQLIDFLLVLKYSDKKVTLKDISEKTRKTLLYQLRSYVEEDECGSYLQSVVSCSLDRITELYNECKKIHSIYESTMALVLGYSYALGWGNEQNIDKAKEYLEIAYDREDERAKILDGLLKRKWIH